MVSTLNIDLSNAPATSVKESSKDAVLVPKLRAAPARGLPVPYPVHKTLVLGEGLDSALAYGRFSSDGASELKDMVKLAIDLPPPAEDTQPERETLSTVINLDIGTNALASFRETIANSAIYERGWFKSGLPNLSAWLVRNLELTESIKPALREFISSVADDVEGRLTQEEYLQLQALATLNTPRQTSDSILGHLGSWAEQSHTELRDQLDEAFATRNWHKLVWWKLFWRVDDVTMISNDILERRWLTNAEKGAIYLAGRMTEAGYPEIVEHVPQAPIPNSTSEGTATAEEPSSALAQKLPQITQTAISTEVYTPQPWPDQISTSRAALLGTTIPPLQALAQRIVLTTFSTTSLSSALSALLYFSVSNFSVFEASAVAALGLVFSLRRMQKIWEMAREAWQVEVREEGRKTLKSTEETVRLIVRATSEKKKTGQAEDEGVVERREVREILGRIRDAIKKL